LTYLKFFHYKDLILILKFFFCITTGVDRREWTRTLQLHSRVYTIRIFKKIKPYLTFLNVPQLERQGADLQTKIEELQLINQSLRENDKIKEDALAHLSDQLLVLSERIQQLKRKQMT
jgi:hypothetical protein